jgi:hypothetical protein
MIIEAPKRRPPFITLLSEPGLGKTTLACMFPDPVIVRFEDGVESVPEQYMPALLPVVTSLDMAVEQLQWIAKNIKKHGRKTVILDTITRGDSMFEQHVVQNDPNNPLSINQACGGFGAGPKAVGQINVKLRKLLQVLNDRGMAVVVLAHATTETVEPPDGDNYSRYTLRMGKHSQAPWVDDVDMVGFICLERFVKGGKDDKVKKAISDGTRQLVCHSTAGNVSKNRFHIEDAITLPHPKEGKNPLLDLIPYYKLGLHLDNAPAAKPEPEPEQNDDDAQSEADE